MSALHGQQQTSTVDSECAAKPDRLFDKEDEWAALMSFSSDPHPGTALGVVIWRFAKSSWSGGHQIRASGHGQFGPSQLRPTRHRGDDVFGAIVDVGRFSGLRLPKR